MNLVSKKMVMVIDIDLGVGGMRLKIVIYLIYIK